MHELNNFDLKEEYLQKMAIELEDCGYGFPNCEKQTNTQKPQNPKLIMCKGKYILIAAEW